MVKVIKGLMLVEVVVNDNAISNDNKNFLHNKMNNANVILMLMLILMIVAMNDNASSSCEMK